MVAILPNSTVTIDNKVKLNIMTLEKFGATLVHHRDNNAT
jgi:hypothetical protein